MPDLPRSPQDSWWLPVTPPEPGRRHPILDFLRTRLITGLLVAFPLVITLFFARFLFNLLDRWSYPISQGLVGRPLPGAGAALAVILVFVLGMLAHSVLGRRLLRFGERLIARVPVMRAVYMGAREITRAFSGDRTKNFRRVVLVPFPLSGVRVVAFQTGEFEVDTPKGRQRLTSVFMPTTPNPTTGFYLLYPSEVVEPSGLEVDEAIRMVISGGLLAPDPRRIVGTGERWPDAPP